MASAPLAEDRCAPGVVNNMKLLASTGNLSPQVRRVVLDLIWPFQVNRSILSVSGDGSPHTKKMQSLADDLQ